MPARGRASEHSLRKPGCRPLCSHPPHHSIISHYEIDGERYFEVDLATGRGRQIVAGVRDLPYEYRGRKVVLRTLELGMAELVAKLTPVYVLKV